MLSNLLVVALLLIGATNINGGNLLPVQDPGTNGHLLIPSEGCGITKVKTTKIVGGSVAKPGAWPWIAAVGRRQGEDIRFKCGGSLITSRHVLTAGHCISYVNVVRLGAHERMSFDKAHRDVTVIRAEKHPQFIENSGTDIAILYLDEDVKFTDHIRPICLPIDKTIRNENFVRKNPFVAGWGLTSEDGKASAVLRQLQVPVLDNKLCKYLYAVEEQNADFSPRVICAGNLAGGDGICDGDSGGPLMLPIHQNGTFPFFQIGLVSFSMDCARENSPDAYVNVPYHVDWIQEMVKIK